MKYLEKAHLLCEDAVCWFRENDMKFPTLMFLSFLLYAIISLHFGLFWFFFIGCVVAIVLINISIELLWENEEFFCGREEEPDSLFQIPLWKKIDHAVSYNKAWTEYLEQRLSWFKGIILCIPFSFFACFGLLFLVAMGTFDHYRK
jgi:hypothetical protein